MKMTTKQSGNILVMFTIGLFVLIVMAALALDGGHLLLNKTRLQNIVDAAALHAAKEVDSGSSHEFAREAAFNLIQMNVAHTDYREIAANLDLSSDDFTQADLGDHIWVDFYDTAESTSPSLSADAQYVRVAIRGVSLGNFLAQVFSFNKSVSAIAQSGPSSALVECFYDLVPMLVCAPETDPDLNTETSYFGLPVWAEGQSPKVHVMKAGAGTDSIGPGNFQLIRINESRGGADIRDAMAGGVNSNVPQCFIPPTSDSPGGFVPTEPGNTVGPTGQGLNTRFGQYQGPVNSLEHPSDTNNCQGDPILVEEVTDAITGVTTFQVVGDETTAYANAYMYSDYLNQNSTESCRKSGLDYTEPGVVTPTYTGSSNVNNGAGGRRVLTVVVGDCTNQTNGASTIPYLGSGCFYLTQSIGNGGQASYVVGEFMYECAGLGIPSGETDTSGAYTIVLYRVPDSPDS